jgi:hypothetical protein
MTLLTGSKIVDGLYVSCTNSKPHLNNVKDALDAYRDEYIKKNAKLKS